VECIPTAEMIADTLMKPLPRGRYEKFMRMMSLHCESGEILAIMKKYTCRSCAREFKSNNKLHKHLRTEAHERTETRYIEELDKGD